MLVQSSYGKSRVRLVHVRRGPDRHDLRDLTVAVRFEGDYDESYTDGDNSAVLPTDTMKNTVYALAAQEAVGDPESFGIRLTKHFLARNERLTRVRIDWTEHLWNRLATGTGPHPHAFVRQGGGTRTAIVEATRDGTTVAAGVADLVIMKSAASAFDGFPRDEYTTLPGTRDRLLATALTAVLAVQPARRRLHQHVDGGAGHPARGVRRASERVGAAYALRDGAGRARHHPPGRCHPPRRCPTSTTCRWTCRGSAWRTATRSSSATEEPHGLIEATAVAAECIEAGDRLALVIASERVVLPAGIAPGGGPRHATVHGIVIARRSPPSGDTSRRRASHGRRRRFVVRPAGPRRHPRAHQRAGTRRTGKASKTAPERRPPAA